MSWAAYLAMMTVLYVGIAVLGAVVGAYALLAWRRSHQPPMLALASGILLLSLGPAVSWLGVYAIGDDYVGASVGCAGTLLAGFACLLASLRVRAIGP
jgi:hypothetical protein